MAAIDVVLCWGRVSRPNLGRDADEYEPGRRGQF